MRVPQRRRLFAQGFDGYFSQSVDARCRKPHLEITRLLADELLLIDEIYDKLEREEIPLYVFDRHNDIQYTFEAGEKRDVNSEEHSLQEESAKRTQFPNQ